MRRRSLAILTAALFAPAALAACSSSTSGTSSVSDAGEGGSSEAGSKKEAGSGSSEAGSDGGVQSEAGTDAGDAATLGALAATKRVLLISVDGMHEVDLASWIAANPTSTLAKLSGTGVVYSAVHTSTPSDSFPGTVAFTTGATPKTAGVYYDDSYDRTLYAPGPLGCGGVDGGTGKPGTEVVFDESVDFDDTQLFSGGIDVNNLPWQKDSQGNCTHVFPHNFIRVNTIFEVVKFGGGYTAWSDKHPAYEILKGPSGEGIDDLYTPEQASLISNAPKGTVNGVNLAGSLALCDGTTNSLPVADLSDYTTCEPAALAYDDVKVQAIINQIDGMLSDGSGPAPVPTLFGMNFQAVSVGEKLTVGGYVTADGGASTPSALLSGAIQHVDKSIGKMVTELTNKKLLDSTLIIVTAKHGQSPIDIAKLAMESGATHATVQTVQDPSGFIGPVDTAFAIPSTFVNPNSGSTYDTNGHLTTDDVGLVWIQHSSDTTTTATVVTALTANATAMFADTLPPGTIFTSNITSGAALAAIYGDPASSDAVAAARAPDVFIQPNWGTIYSGSSKKIAEHGGGTEDDTGVALLVSLPSLKSATVKTKVATTQIAPTIVQALGLNPAKLEGVAKEGTTVLPNLF
jgi:hypothetical protein